MKRLFLLTVSVFTLNASFAQVVDEGYYRVSNAATNRYINVENNKCSGVMAGAVTIDMSSLSLFTDCEHAPINSTPATIIHITQQGKKYDLSGQGTSVYGLTGYYVNIGKTPAGYYRTWATAESVTLYLGDEQTANTYFGKLSTSKDAQKDWNITPVSSADDSYIGVQPTVSVGQDKYLTYYVSFPYSFASKGMTAYTVTKIDSENGFAVYEEVKGVVPANTPVIIKCSGNTPNENRLEIGGTPTGSVNSILKGTYFNCRNGNKTNQVACADDTRILGTDSNGKLALVKADATNADASKSNVATADDGLGLAVGTKYLSVFANSCYINVDKNAPSEIRLVSKAEYDEIQKKMQEEANRQAANEKAFARLTAELNDANATIDSINNVIKSECLDEIADVYIPKLDNLYAKLNALSDNLYSQYVQVALTDDSKIDTQTILSSARNILEEALKAQEDHNHRVEENQACYDALQLQIADICEYLELATQKITETCVPNIATQFVDKLQPIYEELEVVTTDIEDRYAALELTPEYVIDSQTYKSKAAAIVFDAEAAQEEYEKAKEEKEHAARVANEEAYARLSKEIEACGSYLDSIKMLIFIECSRVAEEYMDSIDCCIYNLQTKQNQILDLYKSISLTAESTVDLTPEYKSADSILEQARQAEAEYIADAICGVSSNNRVVGRYTLSGTPVVGTPNGIVIEKLSDGSTRKVRY